MCLAATLSFGLFNSTGAQVAAGNMHTISSVPTNFSADAQHGRSTHNMNTASLNKFCQLAYA
jgi:hypothetical protein